MYSKARDSCSKLLQYKGALVIILIASGVYLFYWSSLSESSFGYTNGYIIFYWIRILQISFPLAGWIADTRLGRYRVIKISLILKFIIFPVYATTALLISLNMWKNGAIVMSYIIQGLDTIVDGGFVANALPLITDQMMGASGEELATMIDWYNWSTAIGNSIKILILFALPDQYILMTLYLLKTTGIAIALCGLFLCQNWIRKDHLKMNPILSIGKILNYARKNKYPKNRSALTYWENTIPSRIDLGKEKYGGPFSEEEVEDVKSFFRLIPLIVCLCLAPLGAVTNSVTQQRHMQRAPNDNLILLTVQQAMETSFISIGIPVYYFIAKPLLCKYTHRYFPGSIKLLGASFIALLAGTLGLMIIEIIGHTQDPTAKCQFEATAGGNTSTTIPIPYYWALGAFGLRALGRVIPYLVLRKFVIAQAPNPMKGLLYGLIYAFTGITQTIGQQLMPIFRRASFGSLNCGFYYYLAQSVVCTVLFLVYLGVAKWYRLRTRNKPVHIHQIVESHIERYMDQEKEHEVCNNANTERESDIIIDSTF